MKLDKDNWHLAKVGDEVYMDCYSSLGSSSAGYYDITEVSYKYDENTGEKFKVIHTEDKMWDSRDGEPYKNPNSMFYLC